MKTYRKRQCTSGEVDGLVALGEADVEPDNEGMHEVIASGADAEGLLELKLLNGDRVEIDRLGNVNYKKCNLQGAFE